MRVSALLAALLLLAPLGVAGEEAAPVSEKPLWFRFELAGEPVLMVFGYLDESEGTGKGYDVAVYDADGDGKPESRGSSEIRTHVGPGEVTTRREGGITLDLPDRSWQVMFELEWGGLTRHAGGMSEAGFSWTTSVDDGFVHFINGRARLYDSAADARERKPNRLGPPFHWVVGTGARGPLALVKAALGDSCGARLRLACRGDDDIRTSLRILLPDGEPEEALGDYG